MKCMVLCTAGLMILSIYLYGSPGRTASSLFSLPAMLGPVVPIEPGCPDKIPELIASMPDTYTASGKLSGTVICVNAARCPIAGVLAVDSCQETLPTTCTHDRDVREAVCCAVPDSHPPITRCLCATRSRSRGSSAPPPSTMIFVSGHAAIHDPTVPQAAVEGGLEEELGDPLSRRPRTAIVNMVSYHEEVVAAVGYHLLKLRHNVTVFTKATALGMEEVVRPFLWKGFRRYEAFFAAFHDFDCVLLITFPTCHVGLLHALASLQASH